MALEIDDNNKEIEEGVTATGEGAEEGTTSGKDLLDLGSGKASKTWNNKFRWHAGLPDEHQAY